MNTEDKEAVKEFVSGSALVFAIVIAFILLLVLLSNKTTDVNTSPSIEVIGKYKECEIVRLNFNNLAEYHYTLYCGKN
jgi:hypothetical protein